MELLTRNSFEGWMQKILERLDRQDELLLAMKAQGQQPPSLSEGIRLFDNQDLCMLLQISKRTRNATAVRAHSPTRPWARKPITAKRTCWTSFPNM